MAENHGKLTKSFVVVKEYLMQIDLIRQCVFSYSKIFHYECFLSGGKIIRKQRGLMMSENKRTFFP